MRAAIVTKRARRTLWALLAPVIVDGVACVRVACTVGGERAGGVTD
jgi:hypothetical protein